MTAPRLNLAMALIATVLAVLSGILMVALAVAAIWATDPRIGQRLGDTAGVAFLVTFALSSGATVCWIVRAER